MKKILLILAVVALFTGCKNEKSHLEPVAEAQKRDVRYQHFGEEITTDAVLTDSEMAQKFKDLKPGDTLDVKFSSEVKEVCQKKGCWMKMNLGEEVALVRFKDYGFFMPKDIAGKELIVAGKAYLEEMSVADQQHYAEDGGKSPEEIAEISEVKSTYTFEANGVLIPEEEKE